MKERKGRGRNEFGGDNGRCFFFYVCLSVSSFQFKFFPCRMSILFLGGER